MATVLASKSVIEEVTKHIDAMLKDEIKFKHGTNDGHAYMDKFGKTPLRFLQMVACGPVPVRTFELLPDAWKTRNQRMDLSIVDRHGATINFSCLKILGTSFPPNTNPLHDHEVPVEWLADPAMQADYPEVAYLNEVYQRNLSVHTLNHKWEVTKVQVTNYFKACASLNKALLLQPVMRMYVPAKLLAKIDAPVAPKIKRDLPAIDAAALAAQAVEASLARSTNGGAQ